MLPIHPKHFRTRLPATERLILSDKMSKGYILTFTAPAT